MFEPAAGIGGTSSIDLVYFLVGLVLAALSAISFLLSSTAVPVHVFLLPLLPAFPLSGFLPFLLLPPLPPFPWIPPTADARSCLPSCAPSSCHLTMRRSKGSRHPWYHFSASLAPVDHSAVSTPNIKRASSVDPSVAPELIRSSTMHLCQGSNCPPRLGFCPPAIVPNIARLVYPFLLCRATASATNNRRLRMVVSMLSQRGVLRAFASERGVWSVQRWC